MQFSKNKIVVAAVAAVMIAGVWVFSAGISDAPKKSISEIEKAVENRDLETFEKYVNLQNFFSEGFDAYLTAHSGEETGKMSAADIGFLSMFKNAVVEELVASARRTVKKGETLSQSAAGNMGGVAEEFGVAAWDLKRVGSSKKRGKAAIVPVTVYDQQVEKDFIFELELSKTDDGVWRVQKVANAEDLIVARMLAAQEKLDKINAGIMKDLAGAVSFSNEKIRLESKGDSLFVSRNIIAGFSAKNNQSKVIVKLGTRIKVYSKNGEVLYTYSAFPLTSKATLGVGEQRELTAREYLGKEKYDLLGKEENKGGKIEVEVSYLKYGDGEEVRKLGKLPPYEKK